MRFHVNDETGEVGVCKAQTGEGASGRGCPFGGDDKHYGSGAEARAAFEASMEEHLTPVSTMKEKFKAALGIRPAPREKPEFHPEDDFTKMVLAVESANSATSTDRALEQAEYDFFLTRSMEGEDTALPASYRELYDVPELENDELSLKGWTPQNSTQQFVVQRLLESAHAHHYTAMENAGLRRSRFFDELQRANGEELTGAPASEEGARGKIERYDQGFIYGYAQAAREAMGRSFDETATRREQMAQLKGFVEERAAFLELSQDENSSDFDEGALDSHVEWLNEPGDWK